MQTRLVELEVGPKDCSLVSQSASRKLRQARRKESRIEMKHATKTRIQSEASNSSLVIHRTLSSHLHQSKHQPRFQIQHQQRNVRSSHSIITTPHITRLMFEKHPSNFHHHHKSTLSTHALGVQVERAPDLGYSLKAYRDFHCGCFITQYEGMWFAPFGVCNFHKHIDFIFRNRPFQQRDWKLRCEIPCDLCSR